MEIKVEGIFEVQQKLREMPQKIQNRSMKKALEAGAQIVLNAAISKVPKKSGKTAAALTVSTTGSGSKLIVSVVCEQEWPFVGVFLEKGTLNHFGFLGNRIAAAKAKYNRRTRLFSGGSQTERMAPRPFMQPALAVAGETAVQVCIDALKQDIENQA
jgi:HK97 gp10 family phage protein